MAFPLSFPRRLCLLAILVAAPAAAQAQQKISLGDGISLSYSSGSLDAATLAGTAEDVAVLVDDEPVASISKLRLATRGAIEDADFTITELEADGVFNAEETLGIDRVTARDLPVGSLRILAEEFDRDAAPTPPEVYRLMGKVALGEVTISTLAGVGETVAANVDRISVSGVGDGRIALIEIDNGNFADETERLELSVKSLRISNASLDPRVFADVDVEALSVTGDQIAVSLASARSRTETATLDNGAPYPARSTITATDLTVAPGRFPGRDVVTFFGKLADKRIVMALDGRSSSTAEGDNLASDWSLSLTARSGDGFAMKGRWLTPTAAWQTITAGLAMDPAAARPDYALALLYASSLVETEISVTAAGVGDAALRSVAGFSGMAVADMRQMLIDEAAGVLAILPGGGAAIAGPVTAFISRLGTLRLTVKPAGPVPFGSLLATDETPDALWTRLNISASHTER